MQSGISGGLLQGTCMRLIGIMVIAFGGIDVFIRVSIDRLYPCIL